jgi:hypothetical protein
MPGHSRPKDGVASLAYVPGIHALATKEGVDGRDKPGHDERWFSAGGTLTRA